MVGTSWKANLGRVDLELLESERMQGSKTELPLPGDNKDTAEREEGK